MSAKAIHDAGTVETKIRSGEAREPTSRSPETKTPGPSAPLPLSFPPSRAPGPHRRLGMPPDNPSWATADARQATLTGDLSPEVAAVLRRLTPQQLQDFCYWYSEMAHTQSTQKAGYCVTQLEAMLREAGYTGGELSRYGNALTDSVAPSTDTLDPLERDAIPSLADHRTVARRAAKPGGLGWDMKDTTGQP